MIRSPASAAILWICIAATAGADNTETNCFAPFLTDKAPEIVEVISKEVQDDVEVTHLRFLSRVVPESGEKVIIYAVMARPTTPGPHPAILVCHGGGGYADMVAPAVIGWAKRGFVSVCQDQPGICNRTKARSTGPCMAAGASCFTIVDSPTDSSLFDGVAAALNGLALLRSQEDVDKSRVGVFGGSWGRLHDDDGRRFGRPASPRRILRVRMRLLRRRLDVDAHDRFARPRKTNGLAGQLGCRPARRKHLGRVLRSVAGQRLVLLATGRDANSGGYPGREELLLHAERQPFAPATGRDQRAAAGRPSSQSDLYGNRLVGVLSEGQRQNRFRGPPRAEAPSEKTMRSASRSPYRARNRYPKRPFGTRLASCPGA